MSSNSVDRSVGHSDDHSVKVHCLDGLVVVVPEDKKTAAANASGESTPAVTGRGDELKEAGKLQKVAQALENKHMDEEAAVVKDHVRHIVAKELNELDGFDR
jgi:hypothetical protein